MSSALDNCVAALNHRSEKYGKLLQHSVECDLTLATITDMVLGEDAPDRSDTTVLRAIRVLINDHKRQMSEIAKLKGECYLLSKTIKYVD